ncbi:MAG TPA: dTDP-4-dehydrorhamnose 3,5-epimerase [Thalassobaculum sp.]
MQFRETRLPGAYVVEMQPFTDERGQFARAWCSEEFARRGLMAEFVQSNVSINPKTGTLRGLHWQEPPYAEVKLVRCVRGAVWDVIVDLRPRSPTYGEWIGVELSTDRFKMLYVPEGFAHGFQVLDDETEVNYLVSAPYAAHAARGIRYDDPAIGVRWPLPVTSISEADRSWPLLADAGRFATT